MNFLYISNLIVQYKNTRRLMVRSDPVCWIYAMRGEFMNWKEVKIDELDKHDLIMILLLPIPEALPKYLQVVQSDVRTIVYIDGPVGEQCAMMTVAQKDQYIKIIRQADYIFTYGEEADGYFKILSGGKEIHYVNIPYPVEYIRSIQTPLKDKGLAIEMAKGFGGRRCDRNTISSWGAFAGIQQKHPNVRAVAHPHHDPDNTGESRVNASYMEEIFGIKIGREEGVAEDWFLELGMLPWMEYVQQLSPCYIGIHLDRCYTRGQFPLECSGLRIPCICSGSDAGRKLFPQTFLRNPWDVDKAVGLGCRLIEDKEFYSEVADYAEKILVEEFSYDVINGQVREITGID